MQCTTIFGIWFNLRAHMNSLVCKTHAYVTDAEGNVCVRLFGHMFILRVMYFFGFDSSLCKGERDEVICHRSCYHVKVRADNFSYEGSRQWRSPSQPIY